ncbi:MAG: hypothetical protein U0176_00375 [Bacteroidia bacterium]
MKKYLILGLVTIFGWSLGLSQDMIRLQDGSWITAKVITNIVGDSLRYQDEAGKIHALPASDFRRVVEYKRRKPFVHPQHGYMFKVEFRASIGDFFASSVGPGLRITNAWQLNEKWITGLGVGMEELNFHHHAPVNLELMRLFRPTKGTAYLSGQLGYAIPIGDGYWDGAGDWWNKPFGHHWGGPTACAQFGYFNMKTKHIGVNASVGFRAQYMYSKYDGQIVGEELLMVPKTERLLVGVIQTELGITLR